MSYKNIYFESKTENGNQEESCPFERMGHACQLFAGRYIILWGGDKFDHVRNEQEIDSSQVWIFNTEIEKWKCIKCNDCPPLLSGASSILLNDSLYIFGGSKRPTFGSVMDFYFNEIYRLCFKEFKWEKLKISDGKIPSPRDKVAGWSNNNKLYFFGGFGPSFQNTHFQSGDFSEISNFNRRLGWNNQLIYYDIDKKKWHSQEFQDKKYVPKPRAAHTCTKLNENKIVLFGGRTFEGRTNELYVLNTDDFSWSKNLNSEKNTNLPVGRSWHAMAKIDDKNLFLHGGLSQENEPLGDAWLLNAINYQWTRIETKFEKRLWHSATVTDKEKQIYIFGGSSTDVYLNQPTFPKHMIKINLRPESLKLLCVNFLSSNLELFESKIKNQIPMELEKCVYLKWFTSPKLDINNEDHKRYISRSEYCNIQ